MIEIDGSSGEGGGQIVRTSLALSMCLGVPIRIRNIRARRANPGLRAQHLAAIHAAAAVCAARVDGATIASRLLTFEPGLLSPGQYEFDVGTAGSTLLVLQTLLPALSFCTASSEIRIRGGTHNPLAPTFEFVREAYLPLIRRLGFRAEVTLERHGFYPRGGGVIVASIEPMRAGEFLELRERGGVKSRSAHVLLSRLPTHIGEREIQTLRARLGLSAEDCNVDVVSAASPGNAVHVEIGCAHVSTVFCGFGVRGLPAEQVADGVAEDVLRYLDADVALDAHLADQVLLPLALSAGGHFSTLKPSGHTKTNAAVLKTFVPIQYEALEIRSGRWEVLLRPPSVRDIRSHTAS